MSHVLYALKTIKIIRGEEKRMKRLIALLIVLLFVVDIPVSKAVSQHDYDLVVEQRDALFQQLISLGIQPCIKIDADNSPTTDVSTKNSKSASNTSISTEYKNALRSAENYLSFAAFSYSGLISQLEFEGYSSEACVYAVDHCGADWNEQAKKSAANYLLFMAFSKAGLIKQLEFEGFTHEQAVYGVEQNGY